MTDRPINMSADQVQALLAGKTQHRVVLKPQPGRWVMGGDVTQDSASVKWWGRSALWPENKVVREQPLPYAIGDRLWVREAFCKVGDHDDDIHACPDMTRHAYYAADAGCPDQMKWRSSATMPRLLSRLTLIVTDVRVQRLQEISEQDAIYEGARPFFDEDDAEMMPTGDGGHIPMLPLKGPVDALRKAWDARHKHPEHQWGANPWVCALTFRVIHQNIDEVKT